MQMIPSDTDGVLLALGGLHRPTVRERLSIAFGMFWLSLALNSVILGMLLAVAGGLTSCERACRSPLYAAGYLGCYFVAALMAYRDATTVYAFDDSGMKAYPGWPFRDWSVPRSDILEARVVRGTFQWTLSVTLRGGKEKRLALSASMLRALGISGSRRAVAE